jgi:2-keto-4-pentenoate hydratase
MTDLHLSDRTVIEELGRDLAEARSRGVLVAAPWATRPASYLRSLEEARAVQTAACEAIADAQRGYTTLLLQAGREGACFDRLVYAPLLAGSLIDPSTAVRLPSGMIGAQVGILFTIGRPYPYREEVSRQTIMTAIVGCELGLVLLGRRLPGSVPLDTTIATADFALHVAHVRGPALDDWQSASRAAAPVGLAIGGNVLERLTLAALLDRALSDVLGLARDLTARGAQLDAGDRTAVGARLPALQVLPGQELRVDVPGLEALDVRLV